MRKTHDRELFLDVISSYKGIKFLRRDICDDISTHVFEGISGNTVFIDVTDMEDDVIYSEGAGYILELGLPNNLIDILFPIETLSEEQQAAIEEDKQWKDIALKGLDEQSPT